MYLLKYLFSIGKGDVIDDLLIPAQDYSPYGPAEFGPIKFVWLNLLVLTADIFIFVRFISDAPKVWWLIGTLLVADATVAAVNLFRREVTSFEINYYINQTRVVTKEGTALDCIGYIIQIVVPVVYFFCVLVIR